MLTTTTQSILILVSFAGCIIIVYLGIKQKLLIKYTLPWLGFSVTMLLISIFPGIIKKTSEILGIYDDANTIFLCIVSLSLGISYGFTIALSRNNERIKDITQTIGLINEELQRLKNRENNNQDIKRGDF